MQCYDTICQQNYRLCNEENVMIVKISTPIGLFRVCYKCCSITKQKMMIDAVVQQVKHNRPLLVINLAPIISH